MKPKTKLFLLGILGAIVCLALNAYALCRIGWGWGGTSAAMNEAGGFLGGVAGPILNFLTFIAVLYTAALQVDELKNSNEALRISNKEMEETKKIADEQVKHFKEEARKSELEKALSVVNRDIDELFDEKIGPSSVRFEKLYIELARFRNEKRSNSDLPGDFQIERFERLNGSMIVMNHLLQQYADIDKSSPLITYYIVKYASTCAILVRAGEFSVSDVEVFFTLFPEKFKPREWLKQTL